jgi:flagellar motor component MotA
VFVRGGFGQHSESRPTMDKASVIGVIIALVCLGVVGMKASHGDWMMFYSDKGFIMVFGGTVSVIFMAMPMSKIKCIGGYCKKFFI